MHHLGVWIESSWQSLQAQRSGAVVDITQIKDMADRIYRHRGGIADGAHR